MPLSDPGTSTGGQTLDPTQSGGDPEDDTPDPPPDEPPPGETQEGTTHMATRFIHDGDSIDYTPASAVTAGDVIVQGDLVGVAKRDIEANVLGALAVVGVFDFPKTTGVGTAIDAGAKVYWDATNSVATTDDLGGANKLAGKAALAAGNDDETVRVRLSQ